MIYIERDSGMFSDHCDCGCGCSFSISESEIIDSIFNYYGDEFIDALVRRLDAQPELAEKLRHAIGKWVEKDKN